MATTAAAAALCGVTFIAFVSSVFGYHVGRDSPVPLDMMPAQSSYSSLPIQEYPYTQEARDSPVPLDVMPGQTSYSSLAIQEYPYTQEGRDSPDPVDVMPAQSSYRLLPIQKYPYSQEAYLFPREQQEQHPESVQNYNLPRIGQRPFGNQQWLGNRRLLVIGDGRKQFTHGRFPPYFVERQGISQGYAQSDIINHLHFLNRQSFLNKQTFLNRQKFLNKQRLANRGLLVSGQYANRRFPQRFVKRPVKDQRLIGTNVIRPMFTNRQKFVNQGLMGTGQVRILNSNFSQNFVKNPVINRSLIGDVASKVPIQKQGFSAGYPAGDYAVMMYDSRSRSPKLIERDGSDMTIHSAIGQLQIDG